MTQIVDSPFKAVAQHKTADSVIRQIEQLLLSGVLSDGEKLPGERDLAERLEVSRPILREAIHQLEERGLLVARHGGGTFVGELTGQVFSPPMASLIARHDEAIAEYLDFRREIEGFAAELAARRATPADHDVLSAIMADMERLHATSDFDAELDADIDLHNAIGEAAHNVILLHTLKACYRLQAEGMFAHRRMIHDLPGARDELLAQHRALVDAIRSGDGAAARRAATDHIDFVARAASDARARQARNDLTLVRQSHRAALAARHAR